MERRVFWRVRMERRDEGIRDEFSPPTYSRARALAKVTAAIVMRLSMLAPTSPHPGQGGEFSLFGMAGLPQGSGY